MNKLHENEVVIFYLKDYLMSLEPNQDGEKYREYDRKTARIHKGIHNEGKPSYWDVKFPDGFTIRKVEDSHLVPIRARHFKSKKRNK